jgi:hypothetical protein
LGEAARLRRIESIRLGERVLGRNPLGAAGEPEPAPATWRRVDLELHKPSGRMLYAALLRGPDWLAQHKPEAGGTVWLDMPEIGAVGRARVAAVGPCPPIEPGPGHVVTATFKHEPDDSILDVRVEGLADPIGVTDTHPFWSEDRQTFVPVGKLRPGERVRTEALGVVPVTSISHRPREAWVYNLEVNGQHVYEVSQAGVLVHNVNNAGLGTPRSIAEHLVADHPERFGRDVGQIEKQVNKVLNSGKSVNTKSGAVVSHHNGIAVIQRPDGTGTMVKDPNGNWFRNKLAEEGID